MVSIPYRLRDTSAMAKPALNLAVLTNEEKLELIDDLWTSINFGALALTPDQREELDLRLDRLEKEGPVGVPWDLVRAEMTANRDECCLWA
jgi:putative addiction module component (TIGR02574 family)